MVSKSGQDFPPSQHSIYKMKPVMPITMSVKCRLSASSAEVRWQQIPQTGHAANYTQQAETWQTFKSGFLPPVEQPLFCLLGDFSTPKSD